MYSTLLNGIFPDGTSDKEPVWQEVSPGAWARRG